MAIEKIINKQKENGNLFTFTGYITFYKKVKVIDLKFVQKNILKKTIFNDIRCKKAYPF